MKKALIALNENVYDVNTNELVGVRVAQVVNPDEVFEVAGVLKWVDCDDSIAADKYAYIEVSNTFVLLKGKPHDPNAFTPEGAVVADDNLTEEERQALLNQ